MGESTDVLRDHLVQVLDWKEAHVGFDRAVDGIPADKRGARPAGFEHTLKWPDDYWPADPEPLDARSWTDSIAAYARSREQLQKLARDVKDLVASVPTGKKSQTYLRAILLTADHTAYHVGQLVAVRRALGIWPAPRL